MKVLKKGRLDELGIDGVIEYGLWMNVYVFFSFILVLLLVFGLFLVVCYYVWVIFFVSNINMLNNDGFDYGLLNEKR